MIAWHLFVSLAGAVKTWLDKAEDPKIRSVSATVNGPLMQALAEATGYSDYACIMCFLSGAPILGRLPSSGRGKKRSKKDECGSCDELIAGMRDSNQKLLERHKEDANSAVLMLKTKLDADAGRMSQPSPLRFACISLAPWPQRVCACVSYRCTPDDVLLASRFGVEQGFTTEGEVKVRPVDDLSASGIHNLVLH